MFGKRSRSICIPVCVALLAILVPIGALGQAGLLRGRVLDFDAGRPMPGANVIVTGASFQRGTVVDGKGRFEFSGLKPGTYHIVASYIGYESATLDDILIAADTTVFVDLRIREVGIEANPITVTASRRSEKLLDAPASITVIDAKQIESRTVLTAADHLKGVQGVDLITTGLNSSRITIRGFNDNLSKSLLTMVDNRIAQVPSIRLTAMQLIPTGTADIDRIEVVSGPAAALYGPNSANGVVHIITKSPFDSQGTNVSIGGGQRDVFLGSVRHAGLLGKNIGFKVSAQYYEGKDFEYHDPVEIQAREDALAGGADPDTLKIGARDFDVDNFGVDARIDYRHPSGATFIFSSGLTRGNNIELSPTGAVQAVDAVVKYVQARMFYGNLFAQAFYNHLDSGGTFSLRTGEEFVQDSGFFVSQIQHNVTFERGTRLTYGADLSLTRPDTRGTTHGIHEDDDDINEVGSYLQIDHSVSDRWDFLAAARVDYHNVIDDVFVSPRLAVVYKPAIGHSVRMTYNRAFQTPSPDQLFTDVLGVGDIFGLGALEGSLGIPTGTDLRAQATPASGFNFQYGANGQLQFRSPFAPLDSRGLTTSSFIDLNDDAFTNVMWGVVRDALAVGLAPQLRDQGLITDADVEPVSDALAVVLPATVSAVENIIQMLDLNEQRFVEVDELNNIDPLDVTRIETFELGYKALLTKTFFATIAVYHTRVSNFIGPFLTSTPSVFLEGSSLRANLEPVLRETLLDPAFADELEALLVLDDLDFLGDGDGNPAGEIASLMAFSASQIPLGTVSPQEATDPTALILTRKNYGDLALSGVDASVTFAPAPGWKVGGSMSYVTENFFEQPGGAEDIALNAPKFKTALSVGHVFSGLRVAAEVKARYVGGFPVKSDVYAGVVDPYALLDLSFTYTFASRNHTAVNVTIQNVSDNKHREFIAVPEIGRVGLIRLTRTF